MNADVAIILERKREAMEGKGQTPKSDFIKAYHYVNQVKQFRDRHVIVQVRKCAAASEALTRCFQSQPRCGVPLPIC